MGWFRVKGGHLEYRGRITRDPFTRWTATKRGGEAVSRTAAGIRFSLIGRRSSARRRMWRALESATRTDPIASAIAAEPARYMEVLAGLSYADALPRAHIELHRLVLVPRAMIAGRAQAAVQERFDRAPALAALDEDVRNFFLNQLVLEMDQALQRAAPSPRRPVRALEEWACVGVSLDTAWADPLWTGLDGNGHVFMYEFPRAGLSRRGRRALEAALRDMSASLSSLSRAERYAMVHAASLRLSTLTIQTIRSASPLALR